MEVKVCQKCHRLFQYLAGAELCYNCKTMLEDKFQEVQEYIAERKGVNITQVSEECDVHVHQLKEWLKEGRLEFAENISTDLFCERCGRSIYEGNFCPQCKRELLFQVGNAMRSDKRNEAKHQSSYSASKMHHIKR